jgi:hypothetical protein
MFSCLRLPPKRSSSTPGGTRIPGWRPLVWKLNEYNDKDLYPSSWLWTPVVKTHRIAANSSCCYVWMWGFVSYLGGKRAGNEYVWEQGAQEVADEPCTVYCVRACSGERESGSIHFHEIQCERNFEKLSKPVSFNLDRTFVATASRNYCACLSARFARILIDEKYEAYFLRPVHLLPKYNGFQVN